MIPLSQLVSRIRVRYEAESGGSTVRWTDAQIIEKINEGLECLAETSHFYERYVTIPVQPERIYYDVRGFTPETVVGVTSVWSTVRNDWLVPSGPTDLEWSWELATGDPQQFFTRGIYWVGVYPHPVAPASGFLRVHFSGIPARMTHPQAVLGDLPDDHYPALEDYALYEMAGDDRQPKRALLHWASYSKREQALARQVDRRLVASRSGRIGGLAGRIGG